MTDCKTCFIFLLPSNSLFACVVATVVSEKLNEYLSDVGGVNSCGKKKVIALKMGAITVLKAKLYILVKIDSVF